MKMHRLNALFIWLVFTVLTGCLTHRPATDKQQNPVQPATPHILFVDFLIEQKDSSSYRATLTNQLVVPGTLKQRIDASSPPSTGGLNCRQLDGNRAELSSFWMADPLHRSVEYVNEEGDFARKIIHLTAETISIRMQLNRNTHFISLSCKGKNGVQEILTTPLKR